MATPAETRIDPATSIGAVGLAVGDLERMQRFYEQAIGLETLERSGAAARLGADDHTIVELIGDPSAPPRLPGTTGLFHLAILLPSRLELARALRRVAAAGWRFTGASDHLVSEALYLNDLEGNGIEIYRDRPRVEWRYADGQLEMATLPLDLDSLVDELVGAEPDETPLAPDTRVGHVHLNVASLAESEAFYGGALGLDVTVRGYPGALFLSAGGYHHHIGLNTWTSDSAPPPPEGARGLAWFDLVVPGSDELARIEARLRSAGLSPERRGSILLATDPSGNRVLVRSNGSNHGASRFEPPRT
jgi:catechol 2,3-dioxygenase